MKTYSVQQMLDWLASKGILRNPQQAEALLLCDANVSKLPIYLQILSGTLALFILPLLLFVYFDLELLIPNQQKPFLAVGVTCVGVALLCYYAVRDRSLIINTFFTQLSLLSMLAGKFLIIVGCANITTGCAIGAIVLLTIPMYWIYPVVFDRFLSSAVLLLTPLYFALMLGDSGMPALLYTLGLMGLCLYLFGANGKKAFWDPLAYGSLVAVSAAVLLFTYWFVTLAVSASMLIPLLTIIFTLNVALGVTLLLQMYKIIQDRRQILQLDVVITTIGIVILVIFTSPAILLALNLLVLGYGKHDKLIMGFGFVWLGIFVFTFLIPLEITLLKTSGYLIGSGILVLVAYYVLRHVFAHLDSQT